MLKLSLRYLKGNKKQSLTIIIGTILTSILLFSVGILFSSFREYLINVTLKSDNYHVSIKGMVTNDDNIISLKEKDDLYYIKYDDIRRTYEYTEKLCHTDLCEEVNYNDKLLSLYGVGDDNYLELFKSLISLIVFILSISVFFIIYNSFQIAFTKKKGDIALLSSVGASNNQICKIFFCGEFICGLLGIILGLVFSILLNLLIIRFINSMLFEVFNGDLKFNFYLPFIWIPFVFLMIIIFIASFLPLLKIRRYKVITLFKANDIDKSVALDGFKNFVFSYAFINYKRGRKKYRGLVICIFILMLLFNSFISFKSYALNIFDNYVNLPKYDISLISDENDYEKLSDFAVYLKADKEVVFKSCEQKVAIPKKNYNEGYQMSNNLFITNLGGGELINRVKDVTLKNNKMYKIDYKPLHDLKELVIGDYKISISLTDVVPFGFENMLLEGNYVLNLSDNDFNLVCPKYNGMAFIKTDEKGLDEKVSKYAEDKNLDISYVNVKKGYEFIDNFILLIKLFMFIFLLIIIFIVILAIFNVTSANVKVRKKEFATLKSLGFTKLNINLCLFFESLIISGKGCFYAFPFILMISRYLYVNFENFFDMKFMIMDYRMFLISFIFCFLLVLMCMFISHLFLYKVSLINNIKDDKF